MLGRTSFFSFTSVPDPRHHAAYNRWHQLDHRPENLALPGVAWGERWVLAPDCADVARGSLPLLGTHYVNMYWFREPLAESITEWHELADRSFQWGRRADMGIAERVMLGWFMAVKGYATERVLVDPDIVPFRPNRGIHLTVTRLAEPQNAAVEQAYGRYDRVVMPELMSVPGVAGGWTFSSKSTTLDERAEYDSERMTTFRAGEDSVPGRLRVTLLYLDGDPIEVAQHLGERPLPGGDQAELLLSAPLHSITPWHWDWFEPSSDRT